MARGRAQRNYSPLLAREDGAFLSGNCRPAAPSRYARRAPQSVKAYAEYLFGLEALSLICCARDERTQPLLALRAAPPGFLPAQNPADLARAPRG